MDFCLIWTGGEGSVGGSIGAAPHLSCVYHLFFLFDCYTSDPPAPAGILDWRNILRLERVSLLLLVDGNIFRGTSDCRFQACGF